MDIYKASSSFPNTMEGRVKNVEKYQNSFPEVVT